MNEISLCPLLLCVLSLGCRHSSSDATSHKLTQDIEVLGDAHYDFGETKRAADSLRHVFTLRNNTSRTVSVEDIRSTCSCTETEIEPESIPPGSTFRVRVGVDTTMVVGKRRAQVVLVFDKPNVDYVTLSVDTFVLDDYRVNIDPLYWVVLPPESEKRHFVKTFRVTEFFAREVSIEALTRVTSESQLITVKEVKPWTSRGWRGPGYTRDSEIVLELRLPPGDDLEDIPAVLVFDHVGASPPKEISPERAKSTFMIRRL